MDAHARTRAIALACACALLGVGCEPVDTWELFDPDEYPVISGEAAPVEAWRRENDHFQRDDAAEEQRWLAQGPIELTVEEAALLALENNRELRVQRFNPAIVATFEQIERGVYDPEVFATADFFEDEAVEVSRATTESFSVTREDTAARAGIRQRLPTGTDVEVDVGTARATSNRSPEQQQVRAGLTVTQSLLRGFGPDVNLASIRQAQLETLASRFELQGFAEALLAETESVYWQHALAARRIRIFEESLEVARQQEQEVEQRIEIGVLPQTEAASARAEVAQREQDLIDARSTLDRLRLRLLRLVNPPAPVPLEAQVTAVSTTVTEPLPITDLQERIELAMMRRPDLNEARLRLDQERIETVVTRNGLLPRLDLFIMLGKTGYAASFSEAVDELDGSTFDLAAGVDFSYPLGNRAAEGRHEAALLSRRQAAEAVDNLAQLVRLDVRLAVVNVERARQQITATAVTRSLREEALRAENERFRVGESTSLLIAQAQRDLLASRIDEVDALVAYRLSLIELYRAEGTLLSRRGLSLQPGP